MELNQVNTNPFLPEDWEVVNLVDVIDYVKGFAFKTKDYRKDGIRIIRVSDTTYDSIKENDGIYIDPTEIGKYKNWLLAECDLIVSTVGSKPPMYDSMVGKVILIDKRFVGSVLNQNAVIIRAKKEFIAKQIFLYNFFKTKKYIRYVETIFRGNANQANITLSDLFKLQLAIPTNQTELRAIAQVLSDTDGLISSLEKLIEKKKLIKQGTMQQLLTGKKRLAGFIGEWEVKKLKDCLQKNPEYGINAPATHYSDELPTYLRITDISSDGKFLSENKSSVDHIAATEFYLVEGDLVFARTGASVGKTYLYNAKDGQLVFAGFLIRVKVDPKKLNPFFLRNYTLSTSYWNWVSVMSMRSGQPGINGNEYAQLPINLPPTVQEQNVIVEILNSMDSEIDSLEQKLNKYKSIKQGMMQNLLTGKIRLV